MLNASHTLDESRTALATSPSPVLIALGSALFCIGLLIIPLWFGAIIAFQYLFFTMAVVVGFLLYTLFPVLYVGYAWWLWFLLPFVRRLVDYYAGIYQSTNVILLAPFLVSAMGIFTVLRHRSRLLDKAHFPFVLVFAALTFGYASGILQNGLFRATHDLLEWVVPVIFGLHLALNWHDYPALRRCMQRTFLWGVAVMGIYAIIQFYVLPPWDSFWMNQIDWMTVFGGNARPFELRVFSTMSRYGYFSTIMMAGLLMLFSVSTWKHLLAAVPGYAAFLLTLVRAAWGGWVLAVILMAVWIKGRIRIQLIRVMLIGALIVPPMLAVPQISNRLNSRFDSFQNLEDDGSLKARMRLYRDAALPALANPIGDGMGVKGETTTSFDSGLLVIALQLGWPGLLLITAGLLMMLRLILPRRRRTEDHFATISTAISIAILALLVFKNSLIEVEGMALWSFASMALASYRYHAAQDNEWLPPSEQEVLAPEPAIE